MLRLHIQTSFGIGQTYFILASALEYKVNLTKQQQQLWLLRYL